MVPIGYRALGVGSMQRSLTSDSEQTGSKKNAKLKHRNGELTCCSVSSSRLPLLLRFTQGLLVLERSSPPQQ